MELNIKFDEKMIVETANRVLDEFEYKGKTIRSWADSLANPRTNADRIRAMTDEELADLIWNELAGFSFYESLLSYLKEPVEVQDDKR